VTVRVLEVFDSLQGEGVWSGTPMTFVRLTGCNAPGLGLACVRWCDTAESWDSLGGVDLTVVEVAAQVRLPRVCLTGGEPLLQAAEVAEFVAVVHERGLRVHLETNGTLPLFSGAYDGQSGHAGDGGSGRAGDPGDACRPDWVTVSPKPPFYGVAAEWNGLIDELKFVVDGAFLPGPAEDLGRRHPNAVVCLQPEAGEGKAGVRRAVDTVLAHPEWRLSLQEHKMLGLR
jgi:7-carboxy-7-deazaguanine synthase